MNTSNPLATPYDQSLINPMSSRSYISNIPPSSYTPRTFDRSLISQASTATDTLLEMSQNIEALKREISDMQNSLDQLRQENEALRAENEVLRSEREKDALHRKSLLTSLENQNARNILLLQENKRLSDFHSPPEPLFSVHSEQKSSPKYARFDYI